MNGGAVWLNDELMVSPGAVTGLMLTWIQGKDGPAGWLIQAIFAGGRCANVWTGAATKSAALNAERTEHKAAAKAVAQAEMERLSDLLWPAKPVMNGLQVGRVLFAGWVDPSEFVDRFLVWAEGDDDGGPLPDRYVHVEARLAP